MNGDRMDRMVNRMTAPGGELSRGRHPVHILSILSPFILSKRRCSRRARRAALTLRTAVARSSAIEAEAIEIVNVRLEFLPHLVPVALRG